MAGPSSSSPSSGGFTLSKALTAFATLCISARLYSQFIMAAPHLAPFGKLEDFDPTLFFGASLMALVTHGIVSLGSTRTALLFGIALLVGYAFEQVGVASGGIFGEYTYDTDKLGVKIGHVPIAIPMAWAMTLYPSHAVVNAVLEGHTATPRTHSVARLVFLAAVDGAVMTMCDVGMDPVFVHNGYWTWLGPKETLVFFGVPQQNFVGWFLTATLASLLYRAIASFLLSNNAPAGQSRGSWWFQLVPLLYFAGEAACAAAGVVQPGMSPLPPTQQGALAVSVSLMGVTWAAVAMAQITFPASAAAKLHQA